MNNIVAGNEKPTVKDKVLLFLCILCCFSAGILLIVFKPAFGLITGTHTAVLGAMLVLTGTMLAPGFFYNLFADT